MSTMSNLTHGLSKKIGPLKAWQWGLIAGGGIIVFTVLKKNGLSLSGKSTTTDDTTLYDAGTSTEGTGTSTGGGGDNGSAPQPIQITITPAEPVTPSDTDTTSEEVSTLKSELAASQAQTAAAKAKGQKRYTAAMNWGKKWKTQAAKNARRKAVTPKQKKTQTTTKKKALPATPKGRRTAFPTTRKPASSAKRNQAGTRTIAARTAQRRVLKPRTATPAKRKK